MTSRVVSRGCLAVLVGVLTAAPAGWVQVSAQDVGTESQRESGKQLYLKYCSQCHGEKGDAYWARRYQTIFDRFAALGLRFVGPQAPAGRQASPWPTELPEASRNVPTYHSNHQTPATATRQMDFVFASTDIADQVHTRALNEVAEWGPSDHCRVEITFEGRSGAP